MGDMLTALPEATRKVFLIVPYHRFYQPLPGSRAAFRYRECNRRMANLAASVPNSMVVDFMIPSEITSHIAAGTLGSAISNAMDNMSDCISEGLNCTP